MVKFDLNKKQYINNNVQLRNQNKNIYQNVTELAQIIKTENNIKYIYIRLFMIRSLNFCEKKFIDLNHFILKHFLN